MAKQIDLVIKETEQELLRLMAKQSNRALKDRVKALLLIKQGKVTYTYELTRKLRRERKTIYTWLQRYQSESMESYLSIKPRPAPKGLITPEVKQALQEKLSDHNTNITSYVELNLWVEETFGLKLKYKTLYGYCRRHFSSRLKVARKSHHKKDAQAEDRFKKTT